VSDSLDLGSAALLGAVQGATEFLPVSSSGHVALTGMALGITAEMPLSMVVLLHFGTLVATVGVFGKDLRDLTLSTWTGVREGPREFLQTDQGKTAAGVLVASLPTAALGLGLEPRMEELSSVPWVIGAGLLVSAVAVLSTRRGGGEKQSLPLGHALIVGIAQGVAVMPGVSRSGSTIAVAMLLGMSGPAAFRFSFLLSLPAVAGATLLSLRHTEELASLGLGGVVGGAVSFAVGLGALLWLRALVHQGRFWWFAVYLVPLGLGLVGWSLYQGAR